MIFYANWEVIKAVVIIERTRGLPRYGGDGRRSLITGDADISSLLNQSGPLSLVEAQRGSALISGVSTLMP